MNCGEWTATGLQLSCSVAWSRLAGNSFCLIPLPHRASNVSWWQLGMAEVSLPDHLPQPCDVPVKRTRNTCPLSTTNASMLALLGTAAAELSPSPAVHHSMAAAPVPHLGRRLPA